MALTDYLASIADAIRTKDGTTEPICARDFQQRILDIPSGDSSQLPPFMETGTFAFEEDTYGPVTIVLRGEPIEFIYRIDELIDDVQNIKINTTVGGNIWGTVLMVNNSYEIANGSYQGTGYGINVNENTVIFTSRANWSPFRAGLTYRWFAWIKEKQEEE